MLLKYLEINKTPTKPQNPRVGWNSAAAVFNNVFGFVFFNLPDRTSGLEEYLPEVHFYFLLCRLFYSVSHYQITTKTKFECHVESYPSCSKTCTKLRTTKMEFRPHEHHPTTLFYPPTFSHKGLVLLRMSISQQRREGSEMAHSLRHLNHQLIISLILFYHLPALASELLDLLAWGGILLALGKWGNPKFLSREDSLSFCTKVTHKPVAAALVGTKHPSHIMTDMPTERTTCLSPETSEPP